MRWPWRRKAKPVDPEPRPDTEAPRCGICHGLRVVRIVYDPATDVRRSLRYCPACDHIQRRKK